MSRRLFHAFLMLFVISIILSGCDQPPPQTAEKPPPDEVKDDRIPPTPPLKETFDEKPVLSLFSRVGDYQPDPESERHPFWRTFIDHFSKVSGLMEDPENKNRAWSFRGIKTIDSVAFFSPIAVEPATPYRISYKVKVKLPENSKTGLGILEFSKFLWIGEQYSEKTMGEYLLRSLIGVEITESADWEKKEFTLHTGPETRMIHLVFYREGEHSRNPVLIDDIEIVRAEDNPLD